MRWDIHKYGGRVVSAVVLLASWMAAAPSSAQPPPPPTPAVLPPEVFAAGTMLVTQESLNMAPQKYPEIIKQLNMAAANATNEPITPYSVNSSSLVR